MEDEIQFIKSEYQDLKTKFREHRKSTNRDILDLKRQLGRLSGGSSVASVHSTIDHHEAATPPELPAAATPSQCMTEGGKVCILPFTYEGESKTACVQKWSDRKPWCPTKVDAEGKFVSSLSDNSSWDYCDFNTNCSK